MICSKLEDVVARAVRTVALDSIHPYNIYTDYNTAQTMMVALFHCLANEDIQCSLSLLAALGKISQIWSTYIGVWLKDDFTFIQRDVANVLETLAQLVANQLITFESPVVEAFLGLETKYHLRGCFVKSLMLKTECAAKEALKTPDEPVQNAGQQTAPTTIADEVQLHDQSLSTTVEVVTTSTPQETEEETLERSVRMNDAERIANLVASAAPIDEETASDDTLPHIAVSGGCEIAAAALVDTGIGPDSRNNAGATSIQEAIRVNHVAIFNIPANSEVNVNQRTRHGNTLLHDAASRGDVDKLSILSRRGAKIDARNHHGQTPLYVAVIADCAAAVRFLAGLGANPHLLSNEGSAPLHRAASTSIDCVNALLDAEADPTIRDKDGMSPLHFAINQSIVKALIAKGAGKNAKSLNRDTPLHVAVAEGRFEVVRALLEANACVNLRNRFGSTPLHVAAQCGKIDLVNMLIRSGADFRRTDNSGDTGLHLSAMVGHLECVKAFLGAGIGVNEKGYWGQTALHHAAFNGDIPLVQLLIDRGADVDCESRDGSTPADRASTQGQMAVMLALTAAKLERCLIDFCAVDWAGTAQSKPTIKLLNKKRRR